MGQHLFVRLLLVKHLVLVRPLSDNNSFNKLLFKDNRLLLPDLLNRLLTSILSLTQLTHPTWIFRATPMQLSSVAVLLLSLREHSPRELRFRELSLKELSLRELSPRLPIMATLFQTVLTVLVSTPSLTLLTLLMHNSLLNLSSLLHLLSDNLHLLS